MSMLTSQITHRLVCLFSRLFRLTSKETSKPVWLALCEGNPSVTVDSPHKGPVTRKPFSFGNVIMTWYLLVKGFPGITDSIIDTISMFYLKCVIFSSSFRTISLRLCFLTNQTWTFSTNQKLGRHLGVITNFSSCWTVSKLIQGYNLARYRNPWGTFLHCKVHKPILDRQ